MHYNGFMGKQQQHLYYIGKYTWLTIKTIIVREKNLSKLYFCEHGGLLVEATCIGLIVIFWKDLKDEHKAALEAMDTLEADDSFEEAMQTNYDSMVTHEDLIHEEGTFNLFDLIWWGLQYCGSGLVCEKTWFGSE